MFPKWRWNQPENIPFQQTKTLQLSSLTEYSGRNILGDKWFSSIPLVRELVQRGLTYVRTSRKTKEKCYRNLFLSNEIPNLGTLLCERIWPSYLCTQNHSVVLVSSMHFDEAFGPHIQDKANPEIIPFHNPTKSGFKMSMKNVAHVKIVVRCLRCPLVQFNPEPLCWRAIAPGVVA